MPRLPAAQPTPRTSLAPTPSATPATAPCPADLGPGSQIGMTVTPGVGSAVVSWIGPPSASSGIQGWLIAPVDQDASAAGPTQWHKVAAGPGCQTVTAKLGGLVSGHRYGFWLEATFVSAEDGLPEERMVGNAAPVVVR